MKSMIVTMGMMDVMETSGGNDYVMPHDAIVELTCVVSVFICLVKRGILS